MIEQPTQMETLRFLRQQIARLEEDNRKLSAERDIWKRACELACNWFAEISGDIYKPDYYCEQAKQVLKND